MIAVVPPLAMRACLFVSLELYHGLLGFVLETPEQTSNTRSALRAGTGQRAGRKIRQRHRAGAERHLQEAQRSRRRSTAAGGGGMSEGRGSKRENENVLLRRAFTTAGGGSTLRSLTRSFGVSDGIFFAGGVAGRDTCLYQSPYEISPNSSPLRCFSLQYRTIIDSGCAAAFFRRSSAAATPTAHSTHGGIWQGLFGLTNGRSARARRRVRTL